MVAFQARFGGTDTGDARVSIDVANETFIVNGAFGAMDDIIGKDGGFVFGAFGGRMITA